MWLELNRALAMGLEGTQPGIDEQKLAGILQGLPQGPTRWIIDDLLAPALLLGDFLDIPGGQEAREGFLRWRYAQHLGLEEPQYVQALPVGDVAWLLVGMPQAQRDAWFQLASNLGRPIHSLVPRWLWLFNRMAPDLHRPGLLLSLADVGENTYTGTLLAWGSQVTLLRQWREPASPEVWLEERIHPTAAYLHREGRTPQDLLIWGAAAWPEGPLPVQLLPLDIPQSEAV